MRALASFYCSFAYSALACFRMGMSGSASPEGEEVLSMPTNRGERDELKSFKQKQPGVPPRSDSCNMIRGFDTNRGERGELKYLSTETTGGTPSE